MKTVLQEIKQMRLIGDVLEGKQRTSDFVNKKIRQLEYDLKLTEQVITQNKTNIQTKEFEVAKLRNYNRSLSVERRNDKKRINEFKKKLKEEMEREEYLISGRIRQTSFINIMSGKVIGTVNSHKMKVWHVNDKYTRCGNCYLVTDVDMTQSKYGEDYIEQVVGIVPTDLN